MAPNALGGNSARNDVDDFEVVETSSVLGDLGNFCVIFLGLLGACLKYVPWTLL